MEFEIKEQRAGYELVDEHSALLDSLRRAVILVNSKNQALIFQGGQRMNSMGHVDQAVAYLKGERPAR